MSIDFRYPHIPIIQHSMACMTWLMSWCTTPATCCAVLEAMAVATGGTGKPAGAAGALGTGSTAPKIGAGSVPCNSAKIKASMWHAQHFTFSMSPSPSLRVFEFLETQHFHDSNEFSAPSQALNPPMAGFLRGLSAWHVLHTRCLARSKRRRRHRSWHRRRAQRSNSCRSGAKQWHCYRPLFQVEWNLGKKQDEIPAKLRFMIYVTIFASLLLPGMVGALLHLPVVVEVDVPVEVVSP